MAELLGTPHSTIIMQVEAREGNIRVKRELENGWFQHIEMPLPAMVISPVRACTCTFLPRMTDAF